MCAMNNFIQKESARRVSLTVHHQDYIFIMWTVQWMKEAAVTLLLNTVFIVYPPMSSSWNAHLHTLLYLQHCIYATVLYVSHYVHYHLLEVHTTLCHLCLMHCSYHATVKPGLLYSSLYDVFRIRTVYWKSTQMMVTIIQSKIQICFKHHQLHLSDHQNNDCFKCTKGHQCCYKLGLLGPYSIQFRGVDMKDSLQTLTMPTASLVTL